MAGLAPERTEPRGRLEKWLVASAFALAGGTEQVVRVVDHLVKLAREERLR